MMRLMCGTKLNDKKNTKELMQLLGINESIEMLANARALQWYGHVLRREEDNILRKALDFEVDSQRKKGRPKSTWKRHVKEQIKKIGLKRGCSQS